MLYSRSRRESRFYDLIVRWGRTCGKDLSVRNSFHHLLMAKLHLAKRVEVTLYALRKRISSLEEKLSPAKEIGTQHLLAHRHFPDGN